MVADHGFSTIAKESSTSPTVGTKFANTPAGQLPLGFVALDLARALELPLIDPDDNYRTIGEGERSKFGNGLIGGDSNSPKLVVAANGGSDLIYLPDGDKELAKRVIDLLLAQDYVSGIFVDTKLGKFPGTLTLDDIALEGAAVTPLPAIAISFRSFDTVCGEPVQCTVEIADTILQQGQGMHGSFSRADTWNFMAMQGPDFKSRYVDPAPASNADVGRTIAHLLHFDVSGKLIGRVLNGVPGKDLKGMADEFKKKLGSGVVALIGIDDGKASAVVGVTDDLSKSLSAVDLVKAGVLALGGKGGGGRPDMAQGGGPDAAKAPEALKAIEAALAGVK